VLPREHRLRDSRAFRQVYARGRSWADPLAALHVLRVEGDTLLVGFSASKKVGGAVQRNRARRRLREAVRRRLPAIRRGHHLVLVARAPIREAPWALVQATVDSLLERARLLCPIADRRTTVHRPSGDGKSVRAVPPIAAGNGFDRQEPGAGSQKPC
jgi:ribonuclease P protein component